MSEPPYKRILQMLRAEGVSVRKLARRLGLSQTAVSNALRGRTHNPLVLYEVSRILRVPRSTLHQWISEIREGELTVRVYRERTGEVPGWLAGEALLRFLPDSERLDEVAFMHAERAARRCVRFVLAHFPGRVPSEPLLLEFGLAARNERGELVWTKKAEVLFDEAGAGKGAGSEGKENT